MLQAEHEQCDDLIEIVLLASFQDCRRWCVLQHSGFSQKSLNGAVLRVPH